MMQPRTLPTQGSAKLRRSPATVASRPRRGLAVLHAKALFQPVPPVYFDDEGCVPEDNSPEVRFPQSRPRDTGEVKLP